MIKDQIQNTHPTIDWDLAVKLAGNKRDLAEEMLALIIKSLPNDLSQIKQSAGKHDLSELAKQLHKTRGGVSYTGLVRLKDIIIEFETAIKQKKLDRLSEHLLALETEINQVLQLSIKDVK